MVADRLDHIHGMAGSAPSGMKTSEISSAAVRAQFDALLAPEPADGAGAAADAPARLALAAARARAADLAVLPLGLQGSADVRDLASLHAAIVLQTVRHGHAAVSTLLLSAGGVTHRGKPAGPAEYLLALALSLDENRAIYGAAVGPDAGAKPCTFFLAPDTLARARARALDPGTMLLAGQARELFTLLGDAGTVDAALAPASVLRAVLVLQS